MQQTGKKPLDLRWVDHNKGDSEKPVYRSRLVAKEFKRGNDSELYAATPPIENLRILISLCARDPRRRIMISDISRAYFYAKAQRSVFVDLIAEDCNPDDHDKCGELGVSMYGTRDAALNWSRCYTEHLIGLGFKCAVSSPCLFYHEGRDIHVFIHGDDYLSVAEAHHLKWMKNELEKKFESKSVVIGPDEGQQRQGKILNRIITYTAEGILYEADPRHIETMIKDMKFEEAKIVKIPGMKDEEGNMENEKVELEGERKMDYKSQVARANVLAQDRPDIQFTCQELSKRMSRPTERDHEKLKKLVRYLKGQPHATFWFKFEFEKWRA